ncbi:helix-turn-helix transcriptional regulator [Anaerotignum propionicum]|uniref:helix-turn-helix transcriptional regulator n=1 Tax=Anaerotignum propionicum TaxID=28446 RepID=UPI00289CD94E|nr:helix-turn-helix transcriptional regulator [Anaerotignum propionicum]
MMKNLRNELQKKNISIVAFASFLGVSEKTAQNKLNGVTDFTYPEAIKISSLLFPEYTMTYLFRTEEEEKTAS